MMVYNGDMARERHEVAFGEQLVKAMEAFDIRPKKLAHKSGVSQRHINALRGGERRDPKISIAAALAQALDVSLDWLTFGQVRNREELTPDEAELLRRYRRAQDDDTRHAILEIVGTVIDRLVPKS